MDDYSWRDENDYRAPWLKLSKEQMSDPFGWLLSQRSVNIRELLQQMGYDDRQISLLLHPDHVASVKQPKFSQMRQKIGQKAVQTYLKHSFYNGLKENKESIKLNEAQLRKIVAESVKKVLKEDRQRLPFASVIDYANEEMPFGFHLEYNDQNKRITLKQDNVGFADISHNGFLSGYFESLSRAFKVIEKYTMEGTGYEHIMAGAIGDWKGSMSLGIEGGFYDTYAQFEGLVDNGDNRWSENPYDDTEYYENMKNPDWYEADTIKKDSQIDNRKAARSLRYNMNRADKEQLHSMDSMNRDVMDTDMLRKIKGAKR